MSGWLASQRTSASAEVARSPISASTTPIRAPQRPSWRATSAVWSLWVTGTSVAPAYQAPKAANTERGGVVGHHGQPVAGPQSRVPQHGGGAPGLLGQLAIGPPAIAVDDGLLVTGRAHGTVQQGTEVRHVLLTSRAGATGRGRKV